MPPSPLTYVNVGPHGTFKKSGDTHTTPADVDAIFTHLEEQKINKVVLHFHGGLVSETRGVGKAEVMRPVYEAAKCHPVSFVWETGLVETIKANLDSIEQTVLFRKMMFWAIKQAGKHLGVDVDSKGVGTEFSDLQIENELNKDFPFDQLRVGEGARGGAGAVSAANLAQVQTEIFAELEEDMLADAAFQNSLQAQHTGVNKQAVDALAPQADGNAKGLVTASAAALGLAKIVGRVLLRFIQRHDHGFYPTVVEEILRELYLADVGAWAWGGMKDAAREMWLANDDLGGEQQHVGRYLLERLAALQQRTGLSVDLVGHSAGSIAICHLLKTSATLATPLKVRNIVLLAPAARLELFHDEVVTKPERYQALRIYTMDDSHEARDRLVPGIYTRSLLYFISGVLEGGDDVPLVGMARYLFDNDTYRTDPLPALRVFLVDHPTHRLVLAKSSELAPAASNGLRCDAISHGGFDEEILTAQSLTYLLNQE
ncbi:hypothetical protein [Rugamonas rubra]|uniref:Alpha/beta hydrolase family protein n=1 Tax=Rugamonas rubra TaxID=758825 RepID=A0A1I4URB6_9BURK|nr:hypothetical protein [Rugamonas rubra]SFM91547.1 hypothetical protein SAMN02982985_05770 [Rugamonas rubra]